MQLVPGKVIFRRDPAHRLLGADAVVVVKVARGDPVYGGGRKLASVLPGEGHPVAVGQRVCEVVLGEILAVVAGEDILPGAAAIGVNDGVQHRAQVPGGVGVLLLLLEIAAGIIGIGEGAVLRDAVFPHELVQAVIDIAFLEDAALFDFGDIAVCVIGVAQHLARIVDALEQGTRLVRGCTRHVGIAGGALRHRKRPGGETSEPVVGVGKALDIGNLLK